MSKRKQRQLRSPRPPGASATAATQRRDATPLVLAAGLVVAALALYWVSLRHPLVFDDRRLRELMSAANVSPGGPALGLRYVSEASFWLVFSLGGNSIPAQRVVNVLLHAATATALLGFFSRLFVAVLGDRRWQWVAFLGALAFVVHPVPVYAVAYLVQRSIVLATLFSVLALWCTLEGLLRRSPWWFAWAAAAYAVAIFSKEHAVMLPAAALALAVLLRGASFDAPRRYALAVAGAIALVAALAVLVAYLRRGVLLSAYEPFGPEVLGGTDAALAYPLSVINQATLYFRYLLAWIVPWPGWMAIDLRVPFPQALWNWPHTAGFAAWVAYPCWAAWLLLRGGSRGLAGFALLCPWLLALTEVVTVRVQEPFVLYRSYLWMAFLPAALPLLIERLAPAWRHVVLVAACAVLVPAALDRIDSFSSRFKLMDDAVAKNSGVKAPLIERAYVHRALAHLDAGRIDLAASDAAQAVTLNPRSPDALFARGAVHLRRRHFDAAIADFDRAVALDPKYAVAYSKRCVAKGGQGHTQAALDDCEKAIALDPKIDETWISRGALLRLLERREAAAESYRRALLLSPRHPSAHYNLGVLLLDGGRRDQEVWRHIQAGCDGGIAMACDVLKRGRQAR